jgi:hypothetical protein
MREKRTLLVVSVISVVMICCIAALVWVKNERRKECHRQNNNIEQLLIIADANQSLIRGMLSVAVDVQDNPDQEKIDEFNAALEPVFQEYQDAVDQIQLQEC